MIHPRLAFHFTFYWLIAWWLLECTIFRMTTNSVCVCYPGPGAGHHVSCEAVRAGGTSLAFICYLHHNPDIDTGLSWTNNDLSFSQARCRGTLVLVFISPRKLLQHPKFSEETSWIFYILLLITLPGIYLSAAWNPFLLLSQAQI